MSRSEGGKKSIYLDAENWHAMRAEAERLGVSLSRVVQMAWKMAKDRLSAYPAPLSKLRTRDDGP